MEASPDSELPAPAKRKFSRRSKIIIVSSIFIVLIVIAGIWIYVINLGISGCGCGIPPIAMSKGSTTSNYTFTVVAVGGGEQIKLSDIYIVVQTADGTVIPGTKLSSFIANGSVYYHGVNFYDPNMSPNDYLSVGYTICIDKIKYASGVGIGLFTKDGDVQYGVYYIGGWNGPLHWVAPSTTDWNFVVAVVGLLVIGAVTAFAILVRKKKKKP